MVLTRSSRKKSGIPTLGAAAEAKAPRARASLLRSPAKVALEGAGAENENARPPQVRKTKGGRLRTPAKVKMAPSTRSKTPSRKALSAKRPARPASGGKKQKRAHKPSASLSAVPFPATTLILSDAPPEVRSTPRRASAPPAPAPAQQRTPAAKRAARRAEAEAAAAALKAKKAAEARAAAEAQAQKAAAAKAKAEAARLAAEAQARADAEAKAEAEAKALRNTPHSGPASLVAEMEPPASVATVRLMAPPQRVLVVGGDREDPDTEEDDEEDAEEPEQASFDGEPLEEDEEQPPQQNTIVSTPGGQGWRLAGAAELAACAEGEEEEDDEVPFLYDIPEETLVGDAIKRGTARIVSVLDNPRDLRGLGLDDSGRDTFVVVRFSGRHAVQSTPNMVAPVSAFSTPVQVRASLGPELDAAGGEAVAEEHEEEEVAEADEAEAAVGEEAAAANPATRLSAWTCARQLLAVLLAMVVVATVRFGAPGDIVSAVSARQWGAAAGGVRDACGAARGAVSAAAAHASGTAARQAAAYANAAAAAAGDLADAAAGLAHHLR